MTSSPDSTLITYYCFTEYAIFQKIVQIVGLLVLIVRSVTERPRKDRETRLNAR